MYDEGKGPPAIAWRARRRPYARREPLAHVSPAGRTRLAGRRFPLRQREGNTGCVDFSIKNRPIPRSCKSIDATTRTDAVSHVMRHGFDQDHKGLLRPYSGRQCLCRDRANARASGPSSRSQVVRCTENPGSASALWVTQILPWALLFMNIAEFLPRQIVFASVVRVPSLPGPSRLFCWTRYGANLPRPGIRPPSANSHLPSVGPSRLARAVTGRGVFFRFSAEIISQDLKDRSAERGPLSRSSESSPMSTPLYSMGWPSSLPVTRSPTGGPSQPDFLPRHWPQEASSLFESSRG